MSIEALRREILSSAEKERERIIREAKEEAEKIVREANEKALKIVERKRSQIESSLKSRMEVALAVKRLEGKRLVYEEVMKLFEETRREAEKRLEEVKKADRYKEIVLRFISRGIESIGGKEFKVFYSPSDKEFFDGYSKVLLKDLRNKYGDDLKIEFIEFGEKFMGGVIVSDPSSQIFYVSTFDGRLKNVFEEKLDVILNILRGGEAVETG